MRRRSRRPLVGRLDGMAVDVPPDRDGNKVSRLESDVRHTRDWLPSKPHP
jgi:hypothetical protein